MSKSIQQELKELPGKVFNKAYKEWIFIMMPHLLHRISVENVNGYYLLSQIDI